MKKLLPPFCRVAVLVSVALAGCAASAPDYSTDSDWLAKPDRTGKPVDVFYVYPTIFADKTVPNMDIRNPELQAKAMNALASQASVFTPSTNVYAPLYRQMSMARLDPATDMYSNPYFRIGADDVERAFDYYLQHFNSDRPFILAGHSQGSMVLIDLLRRRFNEPALRKRLVAAYVIGYSLTHEDLRKYPWLKLAQGADDTGVIITYNTQSPTAEGSPVLLPDAVCVNPLNWTTGPTPADKSLNLGAVFYDDQTNKPARVVPHYAGARIDVDTGALVTTPPEELDTGSFPEGVYHVYDYAFWHRNLEQNVAARVRRMVQVESR